MEAKAIELIQQSAIVANGTVLPTWMGGHAAVIPKDYSLTDLEKYAQKRFRFRGSLSTTDTDSFAAYVTRAGSPDPESRTSIAQVFIDPANFTATAFFNLGDAKDPGHADWRASLSLVKTAAYEGLLGANGETFNQLELVEFIEDWAHIMGATQGDEPMSIPKLIAAVRRMKIKEGSETKTQVDQYAASQSRLDQVSAESDEGLPSFITFTCEPYHGLPSRTFQLRMSILTSGQTPALKLRIVGFEAQKEAMLDDFSSLLRSHLPEGTATYVGKFSP